MSNRTKTDSPFFDSQPITADHLRLWAQHCRFPGDGPEAGWTDDELIVAVRARSLREFVAMAAQASESVRREVAAETMLDLGHGHRERVDAVLPQWAGSCIAHLYLEADRQRYPGAQVRIVTMGGDLVVCHRRASLCVDLCRGEAAVWMRDLFAARGAEVTWDAALFASPRPAA